MEDSIFHFYSSLVQVIKRWSRCSISSVRSPNVSGISSLKSWGSITEFYATLSEVRIAEGLEKPLSMNSTFEVVLTSCLMVFDLQIFETIQDFMRENTRLPETALDVDDDEVMVSFYVIQAPNPIFYSRKIHSLSERLTAVEKQNDALKEELEEVKRDTKKISRDTASAHERLDKRRRVKRRTSS